MGRVLLVCRVVGLAMVALGCTGSGKPTTPAKVVDYTTENVKESVKTAPETARNAGKRITRAVNETGDAISGKDAKQASEAEDDGEAEQDGEAHEGADADKNGETDKSGN